MVDSTGDGCVDSVNLNVFGGEGGESDPVVEQNILANVEAGLSNLNNLNNNNNNNNNGNSNNDNSEPGNVEMTNMQFADDSFVCEGTLLRVMLSRRPFTDKCCSIHQW